MCIDMKMTNTTIKYMIAKFYEIHATNAIGFL